MTFEEVKRFVSIVNTYNDMEYLLSTIMCSAAPTLAREKASSLINFTNNNRNLKNTWIKYKENIKEMIDIEFFELKNGEKNSVVLFYNREGLEKVLREKRNIEFLKRFGYSEKVSIDESILYLKKRFVNACPHEVGIFLGYPVEDVAFFINCTDKPCKMMGYWKVYHNVEEAKDIFKRYDKIKDNFMKMIISGISPREILQENLYYEIR